MCGIAGALFLTRGSQRPQRGQPAPAWCERAKAALSARGPDGHGTFLDDGVALVHTRLALRDVAHGQQPLYTPDGRFTLVVNGEIYDDGRARERLTARGAQFRTRSDSELLLWALVLEGADGLDQLEGEYAFCFWDRLAQSALLGRDPLGVKPLLLARQQGALWFASEVKALLAMLPERPALRPDAVVEALVAPALSGVSRTPFWGIDCLEAGSVLELRAQRERVWARSSFALQPGDASSSTHAALRDALLSATHERLQADVEVGAFLSGGVDSTALVSAGIAQGHTPLRCFTIRFDHHLGAAERAVSAGSIVVGDDAPFVEELAQRWPIALTRVHASRTALLAELDALGRSQDRIAAWEQELSQRFLARAAAREVKAVLVGDAADETHYGYAFALTRAVCASPQALLERFGYSARRALLRRELWPLADALDGEYRALSAQAGLAYGASERADRLATSSLLVQRWLPRLLHNGDMHTLAFGLEARVPFADRRVLALASQVAVDDAYTPFQGVSEKAFLRRAVADLVPSAILARPKSALPRDDGMGPLFRQRLRELLCAPRVRERLASFFALEALDALVETRASPDDITRASLFSVLAFEAFLRHHVG
jgi:asparagine synthase (glutamine-hydrolysing)